MSKTGRNNYRRSDRERNFRPKGERHIYLRTVRRDPPDVDLLAKAFLALALADAARDGEAEATASGVLTESGQDPATPQADIAAPEADSAGKEVNHDDE